VLIEKMSTGSYAYQSGLQPGDIILAANRRPAGSIAELRRAVKGSREVMLNVQREDQGFIAVLR
jgi:serine protease Do/serine protease DegQ